MKSIAIYRLLSKGLAGYKKPYSVEKNTGCGFFMWRPSREISERNMVGMHDGADTIHSFQKR